MKIKFSKFEKMSGLFVGVFILGFLSFLSYISLSKGWFSSKTQFTTSITTAHGIRSGTPVLFEGLQAGVVTDLDLEKPGEIIVHFEILSKFAGKLTEGSRVNINRPFIIGEKVLDISAGDRAAALIPPGSALPSEKSMDLMDFMSGRKLGPVLHDMRGLIENLNHLASSLFNKKRTEDFIEIYDQLKPLLTNLNRMSLQVNQLTTGLNKNNRMTKAFQSMEETSEQMNKFLPAIAQSAPEISNNVKELTTKLNTLVTEMNTFLPMMKEVGPDLPRVGRRAVEALDETVVTLKALQESFILKSSTEKVRAKEEAERLPAKESTP